jgi:hypothetical protein
MVRKNKTERKENMKEERDARKNEERRKEGLDG